MANIKVLDQALINKIAAGEVIERPASVVKELIENAIDAGADIISIDVKEGGKSFIKVTDNGSGMDEKNAELAIERHATSKIKDTDDLFAINTLGFRGEALASIAAVSRLKLITKTKQAIEGTKIEIEGSKIISKQKTGCPDGTSIEVHDLFFNTPVRKNYLRPMPTEFSAILDVVTRYALINYNLSLKLTHNDKVILQSPKSEAMLDNIVNIYGKEIAKEMVFVGSESGDIKINGYISKPSLTRSDKTHQSIYINKRYIYDKTITNAIYDAYHTLLFTQRHPIAILNLDIDPKKIDVNVHPTKREIRLEKTDQVYEAVFNAIRITLQENKLIPELTEKDLPQTTLAPAKKEKKYSLDPDKQSLLNVEVADIPIKEKELDEKAPDINILGQVHNCYIVAEDNEGFVIIDQHAAHERVMYERFMKEYKNKGIATQELLSPAHIELQPTDAAILEENLNFFETFGLKIEKFGNNSFLLRTIPIIIKQQQDKQIILDLIDELRKNKKTTSIDETKERIITYMACRGAVKQGDKLELPQMTKILKQLYNCTLPFTCPHGRPTMMKFSVPELEKKFKRK